MPSSAQLLDGNYNSIRQVLGTTVTASGTAIAAAANSVTITGVSGLTTYITGFNITSHAPVAVVGTSATPVTLTGLTGGTLNFHFVENTTFGGDLTVLFPMPIPAATVGGNVVLSLPAIASGAVSAVALYGFQL